MYTFCMRKEPGSEVRMETNYGMILSVPIGRLARSPSHSSIRHRCRPSGNRPPGVFDSNSSEQVREKVRKHSNGSC